MDPRALGITLCRVEGPAPPASWPDGGEGSPSVCANWCLEEVFLPFLSAAGEVPPLYRERFRVELEAEEPMGCEPMGWEIDEESDESGSDCSVAALDGGVPHEAALLLSLILPDHLYVNPSEKESLSLTNLVCFIFDDFLVHLL